MVTYVDKPAKWVDVETETGIERIFEGDRLGFVVEETGEKFNASIHKLQGKAIEFHVFGEVNTRTYALEDITLAFA